MRSAAAGRGGADLTEGWLDRARSGLAASPIEVPHAAADLAAATAERDGGPASWLTAAECWEQVGDPYRAAYARLRVAELLLAEGEERAAAAEQLRSVVAVSQQIGAHHLLQRAEDVGRRSRLKVATRAPADNPYLLTSREREVLAHVAEGLTDRAIGTRLFISHRTVERHVSSLLAKLNAERRAELIATAHREGLLAADSVSEPEVVPEGAR